MFQTVFKNPREFDKNRAEKRQKGILEDIFVSFFHLPATETSRRV